MRGRKILFVLGATAVALVAAAAPAHADLPHSDFRTGPERTITVERTGYSFHDNNPRNSASACCSVIHGGKSAGTGTFTDPITVATGGEHFPVDFPLGTRFYAPDLRRYLVVENSGAGRPDNGLKRIDVWVDGRGFSASQSERCERQLTDFRSKLIMNPRAGYPVTVGPLTGPNGCRI